MEVAGFYAKVRNLGLEAINNAAELKLQAERKIGEFSRELEKKNPSTGKASRHRGKMAEGSKTRDLKQAGLDPCHDNRYEVIASLSGDIFMSRLRRRQEGLE